MKHLFDFIQIASPLDDGNPPEPNPLPTRWGPASYWRLGVALLGLLIAITLIWRWVG